MKTEGLFLVEIKPKRSGDDTVIKNITNIELPDSVADVFAQYDEIVKKLGDRVQQIYLTVGRVKPGANNTRKGLDQNWIMFDLDYVIQDRKDEYAKLFCEHFKLDINKTGLVDSGYGLQFHVAFKTPATEKDFSECTDFFRTQIRLLELKLQDSGLVGEFESHKGLVKTHFDSSVFRLASLARMPGTVNHDPKKNREMRRTKLIQAKVEPQAESLKALLQIDLGEEPGEPKFSRNLKVDGEYVKQNCGLLKFALETPAKLHEKDFFMVVGLLKACYPTEKEGEQACLEFFRSLQKVTESPTLAGYSEKKALEKIIRALPASYKKIDAQGDWCKDDPGRPKNSHPLQMQSADFVFQLAKDSGFHTIKLNKNGTEVYVPDYDSLRFFFERTHHYISCNEQCWIFNGKYYELYPEDYLKNFAQKNFRPSADTSMVMEFKNLVLRTNLVRVDEWAKSVERKVNFQNGVLDIDTDEFVKHDDKLATIKFKFKSILPYDYDPKALAPNYEKFLEEVTCGSKEFQNILNEYAGYAMSGDSCWRSETLLLHGSGGDGKSTWIGVLKAVAGKQNYSTLSFEDLNNMQARAMLENKFFNVFDETEGSKYIETKVWKTLTTGGEVTVKHLYINPYNIENRAKMIFSCNTIPKSNDTSDGFFRRWLFVPFNRSFTEDGTADVFLIEKLKHEAPGVFNIFLAGYRRLLAQKNWSRGEGSKLAFQDFRETVDPVVAWFNEMVEDLGVGQDAQNIMVENQKVFQNFTQYCQDSNQKIAGNMTTREAFFKKFRRLLISPKTDRLVRKRGSSGSEAVRSTWGIRLKVES